MDETRKYRIILEVEVEVSGKIESITDEMIIDGFNNHGVAPLLFDDDDLDVQAFTNNWTTAIERIA